MVTPPAPPAITPAQMNVLRAVTAMAWADGVLEPDEVDTMSSQLAQQFAQDPAQQPQLQTQLQEYFSQKVPLEEVLPKLKSDAERELVLKLGYLVIAASARTPDEPLVNVLEAAAFQQLVTLLGLSPEKVHQISESVAANVNNPELAPIDALVSGFAEHYAS